MEGRVGPVNRPVNGERVTEAPPAKKGGPELLYIRFTSKDTTSILAQVLKVKVELLGLY